jgi:hypothetical protein
MQDVLLTQGTVRFLGQTGKRFGVVGALAASREPRQWTLTRWVIAWPGIMEHEKQPHECDQHQLVEKQVWNHRNAPLILC